VTEFPLVFEPIRLRHKTLRSRITFGAHTANMAEDGLRASAISAITGSERSAEPG